MISLSIIIPVYRVENYIKECLNSILSQSFADFELILVDDGSPDSSGAVCDEYAAADRRIRVFHKENGGQSSARNLGVREARSDLLCFIDSDDIIAPGMLSHLVSAVENCGAAFCAREQGSVPSDSFFAEKKPAFDYIVTDENGLISLFESGRSVYWTPFPCVIKKEICLANPLSEGRVMEDNAISPVWLHAAKRVAVTDEKLYFYRDNPTGTMNAPFSPKKLDFLWALSSQLEYFERIGYKKMLGIIAKEYMFNAFYLADRVKDELRDDTLAADTVKQAKKVYRKYVSLMPLSENDRAKIIKRFYPLVHKIKKKLSKP